MTKLASAISGGTGFFSELKSYSGFTIKFFMDFELYVGFTNAESIDADVFTDELASNLGAETSNETRAMLRKLSDDSDEPCIIITMTSYGICEFTCCPSVLCVLLLV